MRRGLLNQKRRAGSMWWITAAPNPPNNIVNTAVTDFGAGKSFDANAPTVAYSL
jgi:hypothetical protein